MRPTKIGTTVAASQTGDAHALPGGFANTGIFHAGRVNIIQKSKDYILSDFNPEEDKDLFSTEQLIESPSRLLLARSQITSFSGRGEYLTALTEWRDHTAPRSAVLLFGEGGAGKTRLAQEFALDSQRSGWTVLCARNKPAGGELLFDLPDRSAGRGYLLIVDYADRWPTSRLEALVVDELRWRATTVRLLFVARSSTWWSYFEGILDENGIAGQQLLLERLNTTDRTTIYEAALSAYSNIYGIDDFDGEIPGRINLNDEAYGLALNLQIAALTLVEATRSGQDSPSTPALMTRSIISREKRHWKALSTENQKLSEIEIARIVALATLCGPCQSDAAIELLTLPAIGLTITEARAAVDVHESLFPGFASEVLNPLEPDRVGEDFISLQLLARAETGTAPDFDLLNMIKAIGLSTSEVIRDEQRRLLTVLIAASSRWPNLVASAITPILLSHPDIAIRHGGELLSNLVALPGLTIDHLELIESTLPAKTVMEFDQAIAHLALRIATAKKEQNLTLPQRIDVYTALVSKLVAAGKFEDALSQQRKLLGLIPINDLPPQVYQPLMGAILSELGKCFLRLGRLSEARSALEDAQRYLELALRAGLDLAKPLAATYIDESELLLNMGEYSEARARSDLAIQILRPSSVGTQVETRVRADLAAALSNKAVALLQLGKPEAALTTNAEATKLRRELLNVDPDYFEPSLTFSLNNAAAIHITLNNWVPAAKYAEEVVKLRRRFAQSNFIAFAPALARALSQLSLVQLNLDVAEATRNSIESADIFWDLNSNNRTSLQFDFATCLLNLGNCFRMDRRIAEAQIAYKQAVKLLRRATYPDDSIIAISLYKAYLSLSECYSPETPMASYYVNRASDLADLFEDVRSAELVRHLDG